MAYKYSTRQFELCAIFFVVIVTVILLLILLNGFSSSQTFCENNYATEKSCRNLTRLIGLRLKPVENKTANLLRMTVRLFPFWAKKLRDSSAYKLYVTTDQIGKFSEFRAFAFRGQTNLALLLTIAVMPILCIVAPLFGRLYFWQEKHCKIKRSRKTLYDEYQFNSCGDLCSTKGIMKWFDVGLSGFSSRTSRYKSVLYDIINWPFKKQALLSSRDSLENRTTFSKNFPRVDGEQCLSSTSPMCLHSTEHVRESLDDLEAAQAHNTCGTESAITSETAVDGTHSGNELPSPYSMVQELLLNSSENEQFSAASKTKEFESNELEAYTDGEGCQGQSERSARCYGNYFYCRFYSTCNKNNKYDDKRADGCTKFISELAPTAAQFQRSREEDAVLHAQGSEKASCQGSRKGRLISPTMATNPRRSSCHGENHSCMAREGRAGCPCGANSSEWTGCGTEGRRRSFITTILVYPATRFLPDPTRDPSIDLAHVGYRLATLSALPSSVPVSRIRLADTGFYFRGQGDEVVCYSCGARHSGWRQGDRPSEVHQRLSPHCQHVVEERTGRLSITESAGPGSGNVGGAGGDGRGRPLSNAGPSQSGSGGEQANRGRLTQQAASNQDPRRTQVSLQETNTVSFTTANTSQVVSIQNTTSTSTPRFMRPDGEPSAATSQNIPGPTNVAASVSPASSAGNGASAQSPVTVTTTSASAGGDQNSSRFAVPSDDQRTTSSASAPPSGSNPEQEPRPLFPRAGLELSGAVYPMYQDMQSRRRSFTGWDETRAPPLDHVIMCGMFYAGYADCVRCFYCGVGLKHWVRTDDVWTEHVRWRPGCEYLRTIKGDDFIRDVQRRLSAQSPRASQNASSNQPDSATGARPASSSSSTTTAAAGDGGAAAATTEGQRSSTTAATSNNGSGSVGNGGVGRDVSTGRDVSGGAGPDVSGGAGRDVSGGAGRDVSGGAGRANIGGAGRDVSGGDGRDVSGGAGRDVSGGGDVNGGRDATGGPNLHFPDGAREVDNASEDQETLSRLHAENQQLSERFRCRVCQTPAIDTILMPCGHLVCCENCARAVTSCPLCHEDIRATAHVFLT